MAAGVSPTTSTSTSAHITVGQVVALLMSALMMRLRRNAVDQRFPDDVRRGVGRRVDASQSEHLHLGCRGDGVVVGGVVEGSETSETGRGRRGLMGFVSVEIRRRSEMAQVTRQG